MYVNQALLGFYLCHSWKYKCFGFNRAWLNIAYTTKFINISITFYLHLIDFYNYFLHSFLTRFCYFYNNIFLYLIWFMCFFDNTLLHSFLYIMKKNYNNPFLSFKSLCFIQMFHLNHIHYVYCIIFVEIAKMNFIINSFNRSNSNMIKIFSFLH